MAAIATAITIDNNTGVLPPAPNATNFAGTVVTHPTPAPIAVAIPQTQQAAWIVFVGIHFVEKEKEYVYGIGLKEIRKGVYGVNDICFSYAALTAFIAIEIGFIYCGILWFNWNNIW